LDFIQGLVVVEEGIEGGYFFDTCTVGKSSLLCIEGGYGNDFQREELKFLEDSQSDNQD
jgi:hypothetical protein